MRKPYLLWASIGLYADFRFAHAEIRFNCGPRESCARVPQSPRGGIDAGILSPWRRSWGIGPAEYRYCAVFTHNKHGDAENSNYTFSHVTCAAHRRKKHHAWRMRSCLTLGTLMKDASTTPPNLSSATEVSAGSAQPPPTH